MDDVSSAAADDRAPTPARIPVVWDMETGDPDDFLTLLLLCDHPRVELRGVTITPGTPAQVGLVRRALEWFELADAVPVGAFNLDHGKRCVSAWHERAYGAFPESRDAHPGAQLLLELCGPEVTLVTGAPLKNLGAAITLGEARGAPFRLGRHVAQGGFAGEGVVPPQLQLAKFRGLEVCPTYNLNGAPKEALAALAHPGIARRRFVSKNVCHGVLYDAELHARVAAARTRRRSLELIWRGMDAYLARKPEGKKFHDPLAACCAIEPTIGVWAEVELFRRGGRWGARLEPGSTTEIIVDYDRERFIATLLG
ncbi:MAG: nucleoside hydrolase [Nannocystaceae bacterium]